ncbi:MAG: restriction endonuclease subunit S [Candidatus Contendobacter sp.]|nr:restriction endonuclease subunit S [Candidatus Contendobacter sp.]
MSHDPKNSPPAKGEYPEGGRGLVPKLRFPKFREAAQWSIKPLKQICTVNPATSELPEIFVYIDLESVEAGELKEKKIINREDSPSRAQRLLNYGDVIFQIVRPYQRNNFYFRINDDFKYVASTGYAQLRAFESKDYLFQAIHTDNFVEKVIEKCTGSSYPAINSSDLAEVSIAIPKTAEQQKIADCLASLDELITLEAQKLDTLKTHKKGLMQQLFPAEGETVPKLRFPEFLDAREWCNDSLGKIFETTAGGTPSRSIKEYWDGKIPWITTSLVDFNVIYKSDEFISETGLENSSAKIFPKGTILIAMYGQGKTRGKVAILGIEAATNQACAVILPKKGIHPEFVFLNMGNRYEEMRELSNSGGQENLSQGLIKELPFSFPQDITEQQKIASCLASLDDLIIAQAQKLATLKTHKKGLMQQLFPALDEVQA